MSAFNNVEYFDIGNSSLESNLLSHNHEEFSSASNNKHSIFVVDEEADCNRDLLSEHRK